MHFKKVNNHLQLSKLFLEIALVTLLHIKTNAQNCVPFLTRARSRYKNKDEAFAWKMTNELVNTISF